MTQERSLRVLKPTDTEIVIERPFSAPREAVFAALTDASRLMEWMRPSRMKLVSCEVDLRVGGKLRYVFERKGGKRIEVRGVFTDVESPHRYAYLETYDFSPLKVKVTASLAEVGSRTLVTQTLAYATQQERDEDFPGIDESSRELFANLDRYILKGRSDAGVELSR